MLPPSLADPWTWPPVLSSRSYDQTLLSTPLFPKTRLLYCGLAIFLDLSTITVKVVGALAAGFLSQLVLYV
jgi:hypothetical protein